MKEFEKWIKDCESIANAYGFSIEFGEKEGLKHAWRAALEEVLKLYDTDKNVKTWIKDELNEK